MLPDGGPFGALGLRPGSNWCSNTGMRWGDRQVRGEGIGDDAASNRVPGGSPVPSARTVAPGRTHDRVRGVSGDTPVLLADGTSRPIAALRVGDEVLGSEPDGTGGLRRYVRTPVLALWSTRRRVHRVTLTDGTTIVAGGEHRVLADDGWRHVAPGWCRSGRRPHLRAGTVLRGPGAASPAATPPHRSADYGSGYLCGLVRADAARTRSTADPFPSEWVELEALARAHHLLAGLAGNASAAAVPEAARARRPVGAAIGAPCGPGRTAPGGLGSGLPAPVARSVAWPREPGAGWSAGFAAGVLDACGEVTGGELRIVVAGQEMARRTAEALGRLGFRVAAEPAAVRDAVRLRLRGGAPEHLRLVGAADPAVGRVRDVSGAALGEPRGGAARVESVRELDAEMAMVAIATGTGDVVAAGVVSRTCAARPPGRGSAESKPAGRSPGRCG